MNTTYTDTQLQLALAKMLPDRIILAGPLSNIPYWRSGVIVDRVIQTEWLHVCWLIEQTFTDKEDKHKYALALEDTEHTVYVHSATWQQRAVALAKVKGIEIV